MNKISADDRSNALSLYFVLLLELLIFYVILRDKLSCQGVLRKGY